PTRLTRRDVNLAYMLVHTKRERWGRPRIEAHNRLPTLYNRLKQRLVNRHVPSAIEVVITDESPGRCGHDFSSNIRRFSTNTLNYHHLLRPIIPGNYHDINGQP